MCGATNAPAPLCSQCNFPAEATAEEIELGKMQGTEAVYRKRENDRKIKAEWLAQPILRKILDNLSRGVSLT